MMRFIVLFNVRCQQLKSVKLNASHLDEWNSKLLLQKVVEILEGAVA